MTTPTHLNQNLPLSFYPAEETFPSHVLALDGQDSGQKPHTSSSGHSSTVMRYEKGTEPRRFDGTTVNARDWLEVFEIAAETNKWVEADLPKRVGSYFEGTAFKWYMHNSREQAKAATKDSWTQFKDKLVKQFPGSSSSIAAHGRLTARTQILGEPIETYVNDKLELCDRYDPDMSVKDQVSHLMLGLLPSTFEKLHPLGITTVQGVLDKARLYSESTQLANSRAVIGHAYLLDPESEPYNMAMMKTELGQVERNRQNEDRDDQNARTGPAWPRNNGKRSPYKGTSANQRNGPGPRGQPSRFRGSKTIVCYNCSKAGHIARNCYAPKNNEYSAPAQTGRRQGNWQ